MSADADPEAFATIADEAAVPPVSLGRDSVGDLAELVSFGQGLIGEIAVSPAGTTLEGGTLGQLAAIVGRLQRRAGVAPAAGWTLETAPRGSRGLANHGELKNCEWAAIGDGRWAMVSPLDEAAKGIVRAAETLAYRGGRLTLVPVEAAPVRGQAAEPEPADDSTAGRTASYAHRAAILHGRLAATLGVEMYACITARSREGNVQVASDVALAAAQASVALLPGGRVSARTGVGKLWIETAGIGADEGLEIVAPIAVADMEAARAWLAEIGVEVKA